MIERHKGNTLSHRSEDPLVNENLKFGKSSYYFQIFKSLVDTSTKVQKIVQVVEVLYCCCCRIV